MTYDTKDKVRPLIFALSMVQVCKSPMFVETINASDELIQTMLEDAAHVDLYLERFIRSYVDLINFTTGEEYDIGVILDMLRAEAESIH
jgi:hypothetical protein